MVKINWQHTGAVVVGQQLERQLLLKMIDRNVYDYILKNGLYK